MHTKTSAQTRHTHDSLSSPTAQNDPICNPQNRRDKSNGYDTPHNLKVSRFLLTGPEYGEVASVVRQDDE